MGPWSTRASYRYRIDHGIFLNHADHGCPFRDHSVPHPEQARRRNSRLHQMRFRSIVLSLQRRSSLAGHLQLHLAIHADPRVRDVISSFPSGHRSFYSDSFPAVRYPNSVDKTRKQSSPATSELISAVDVYCDEKLIYSKVTVTETLSGWFNSSPFRVDLLDPKETVPTPMIFSGEDGNCLEIASNRLRVSRVLIDPLQKRAVSIASVKAVEARRHWLTEDLQLRFATVAAGGTFELVQFSVMVICGGKEGGELQVREVNMQAEDLGGKIVSGMEGLVILQDMMVGQRCRRSNRTEREMYEMFMKMKIQSRERKERRERSLDNMCIIAGVCTFMAMWIFFLSR